MGNTASAPGLVPGTAGSSMGQGGGMALGGDQWAAWKEIQMQNMQMSALEDTLSEQCSSLGIDMLHILVSIDSNLNASYM